MPPSLSPSSPHIPINIKDSFRSPSFQMQQTKKNDLFGASEPSVEPDGSLFINRELISHLKQLNYPGSIEMIENCNKSTGIGAMLYCENNCFEPKEIHFKHHCNQRTCIFCSKRIKRKRKNLYLPMLQYYCSDRTNFIYTFSISPLNYIDEKIGIEDIRKKFNKLLRWKYFKDRIIGGLYVIESKQVWKGKPIYNRKTGEFLYIAEEDGFNIHIHAIVYGKKIDNQIRGRCLDCNQNLMAYDYKTKKHYCKNSRCNSYNVVVTNKDSKITRLWKENFKENVIMYVDEGKSRAHSLNYVLKYITEYKDDFKSNLDLAKHITLTYRKRLIFTFGDLFGKIFPKPKLLCSLCESELHFWIGDTEIHKRIKISKPPNNFYE